ncbi:MAG: hypothetical protein SV062_01650 [Thermodesulfobacteriota bacterium]|nr:hypothetical protein [Thermodesulfobacteriota bacterium]
MSHAASVKKISFKRLVPCMICILIIFTAFFVWTDFMMNTEDGHIVEITSQVNSFGVSDIIPENEMHHQAFFGSQLKNAFLTPFAYAMPQNHIYSFELAGDTPSFELKGDVSCAYGSSDCQRCVNDINSAFERLNDGRRMAFSAHVPTDDPFPPQDDVVPDNKYIGDSHIQSMVRVSFQINSEGETDYNDESWIVLSRSGASGDKMYEDKIDDTGLYFIHMDNLTGTGDTWYTDRPFSLWDGELMTYYNCFDGGLNHAGGMQAVGSILAVSYENAGKPESERPDAQVRFYDIVDPWNVKEINKLVLDGSRGEEKQEHTKSSAVAITKLEDGRYLLFVGGFNNSEDGWFYISSGTDIASSNWEYIQYWSKDTSEYVSDKWDEFQSLNFFSKCDTGDIYLIGLGGKGICPIAGEDSITKLYKLVRGADDQLDFQWIATKDFNATLCRGIGPVFSSISMRYGANIYVTSKGDLIAYASSRTVRGILKGCINGTVCFNQWDSE